MRGTIYYINGLILTLTIISGAILASSTSSAETTFANASVIVPSACTFTATEDTAHTAEIPAGTYKDNIGTTTLKTICNDSEGFSIYAIGFSNSENGNNKLLATVGGSLSPTNDINTGTNTSGSPSSWAMKLAQSGTGAPTILSGYDNYSNVPSTNTKVATLVPSTSISATIGSSITATYAANISSTQPAGTYNGKVKYIMVHPASETPLEPKAATPKCISYWPNASGVADSMADDCNSGPTGSGYGNNATANLWASNFQRDGYGFAGWTDKFDWVLNENDAEGNGTGANAGYHIYGPNATITTPADMVDKGLSLYPVWVKSSGNLQSWNYCAVLNTGDVTALTDTRDNETYAIAKLADGNCWMIENLRLADQTPTGTTIELSTTNTNNPLNTSGTVTIKNSDGDTTNHLSTSQDPTSTAWCTNTNAACYDQSMLFSGNTVNPANPMNASNASTPVYSYGNYYNWYSATAGNGTYSFSTNNNSVAGDICPAGWSLPKGGDKNNSANSDFWKLSVAAIGTEPANTSSQTRPYYTGTPEGTNASNILRSYPNNFVYSGYVLGSSVGTRSTYGYYWSSTAYSSGNAYALRFYSSYVTPGTYSGSKYHGFMARCIVSGS